MFPEPEGIFPETPEGAEAIQLKLVFPTGEEMMTVWNESPLQMVCGLGRIMVGDGLTNKVKRESGPGQLLADGEMVNSTHPVVSAGLLSVWEGMDEVVPDGINPVIALGDDADHTKEVLLTVEVNGTAREG